MPRVLKSSTVIIDENHRVTINTKTEEIAVLQQKLLEEKELKKSAQDKESLLKDAQTDAQKIIINANKDAQEIITDAEKKAEQLILKLKEDNEKIGYEDAYNKGLTETEDLKLQAKTILEEAIITKDKMIENIEPEIVELIVSILDKLFIKTAKIEKSLIIVLIKQGLKNSNAIGEIFIRVCEEDYENVVENKQQLLLEVEGSSKLEIIKDFSLGLNDCIIETPFGNVDCSLIQQYESLKKQLYYLLENR